MDVQGSPNGSVAALLPIIAVLFIAYLVIGLACRPTFMNTAHRSMRNVPSNRLAPTPVHCSPSKGKEVDGTMHKHEDHGSGQSRDTIGEGRSVAALMLVMTLVFTGYFVMLAGMPELPLPVQHALALLPS